jgi:hypothetical protein
MDPRRALLLPPELKAAPIESLTEQLFIERSLTENRFWLRIMKEHALFLGEGFSRGDTQLIQEADRFFHYFDQLLQRAHTVAQTVQAIRALNQESIQAATAFRNFKRNILILIINCKISSAVYVSQLLPRFRSLAMVVWCRPKRLANFSIGPFQAVQDF